MRACATRRALLERRWRRCGCARSMVHGVTTVWIVCRFLCPSCVTTVSIVCPPLWPLSLPAALPWLPRCCKRAAEAAQGLPESRRCAGILRGRCIPCRRRRPENLGCHVADVAARPRLVHDLHRLVVARHSPDRHPHRQRAVGSGLPGSVLESLNRN
jgi:hypothetical protein